MTGLVLAAVAATSFFTAIPPIQIPRPMATERLAQQPARDTQPDPRSVYRVSKADSPVILGAALAAVLPNALAGHLIRTRCPCDPRRVNAFDRHAIGNHSALATSLSDATAAAAMVVPVALDALDIGMGATFAEDATVFTETLAVNGALVSAAKYIVQRPIPRTYAGDAALEERPEGYRSFYSGHTSLVFAALAASAETIGRRHGNTTLPWLVVALVGSSVAIERVAGGWHFPTDVMAGAIMGTATGIVVPRLHARTIAGAGQLSVRPSLDRGFRMSWMTQF